MDQVAWMCRRRHYSERTAEAYGYRIRRYIYFHRKRHPREMGRFEIEAFLNSLAARHLSASSQSQALNGIVFLYQQVLEQPFDWLEKLDRPKRAQRLPSVRGGSGCSDRFLGSVGGKICHWVEHCEAFCLISWS